MEKVYVRTDPRPLKNKIVYKKLLWELLSIQLTDRARDNYIYHSKSSCISVFRYPNSFPVTATPASINEAWCLSTLVKCLLWTRSFIAYFFGVCENCGKFKLRSPRTALPRLILSLAADRWISPSRSISSRLPMIFGPKPLSLPPIGWWSTAFSLSLKRLG